MASKTEFLGYLAPGTQLHEYRIERVLGHGGFGITYLARDTLLDKDVAIKEYLPTDLAMRAGQPAVILRAPDLREAFIWGREQFLKEARTLARFAHPNLITVHRFFEANDTAYFVMEYAQGQTLAQILKREGSIDETRVRDMLMPILMGLEKVHEAGVLHRDIKPDNIMLRADGTPVLIDFGAARLTLGSKTRSILSVLTAGYAPLEQYGTAGTNQGPWTDIYALGAVIYRAIAGKKPPDAVSRVHTDPLMPASMAGRGRYGVKFLAAVDWSLCVVPEQRPRSIGDWRAALEGEAAVPAGVRTEAPEATAEAGPTTPSTWQELAESAAREAAEFSGELPESRADRSTDSMQTPSISRSLTMTPAATPAKRTTWIVAGLTLLLVLAWFRFFILRGPAAPPPPPPVVPEAAPAPAVAEPPLPGPRLDTTLASPPPVTLPPPEPAPAPSAETPAPAAAAVPAPATPSTAAPTTTPAGTPPAGKRNKTVAPAPDLKKGAAPAPTERAGPVAKLKALTSFRDCPQCPEMMVLPTGRFTMGAPADASTNSWERPAHTVEIGRALAIAQKETTVAEWRACVAASACDAGGGGRDPALPAINVSWFDAEAYAKWLTKAAGRSYRLPSEAEWEFAARAGTISSRYWGDDRREQCVYGNGADQSAREVLEKGLRVAECDDHFARLAPAGSYQPNVFGLFDMVGNAWEWTLDCWHDSYDKAPRDGHAVDMAACPTRVIRGGSWRAKPEALRSFSRGLSTPDHRADDLGFRVVAE